MKISSRPTVHLTYCLNIHPGETWQENFQAIKDKALAVRRSVCPDKPFGLGLRLGNDAVGSILKNDVLSSFKSYLAANNLYAFTINGFPYGSFHGTRVKETVYKPDWRTRERLEYTVRLVDVMAGILPENITGSISTVPGSYKKWIRSQQDVDGMVRNIAECTWYLEQIYRKCGKTVCLALEPEPDCFIEKTDEAVKFFNEHLFRSGAEYLAGVSGLSRTAAEECMRRYVGICFDTCHIALQFEDMETSLDTLVRNGIRIPKVQLSSAVSATAGQCRKMARFVDPVYLHQVKVRSRSGVVTSYDDLTIDLLDNLSASGDGEIRAHFHVPLYFTGDDGLGSTSCLLTAGFFKKLLGMENYLEIETYTYGVLPEELRARDVSLSITDEFKWVLGKIGL
ncbi:MAG: hypothetical protein A2283_13555 [Lentisphaerae bacterium RIFOXYA12_FULL_48_11]|nr:MAG: hypothetical protein A2283_13555 [Lentisphaerae bacterium RIFOXYA12_FULL_48_11]